jgi:hypothetical protein
MASINKSANSADRRGTTGKGDATRGSLAKFQASSYWDKQEAKKNTTGKEEDEQKYKPTD